MHQSLTRNVNYKQQADTGIKINLNEKVFQWLRIEPADGKHAGTEDIALALLFLHTYIQGYKKPRVCQEGGLHSKKYFNLINSLETKYASWKY